MYRKAIEDLSTWARKEKPKPLILRGARQVGKSFLVHMLARELGLDLLEVNLEKKTLRELDNREDFSIEKVLSEISLSTKKRITSNSLIFLDEIQAQPLALASLRYFYEDKPGVKVISAGSLLEAVIHKNQFSMPVGRIEYYYLSPMTFFEFLQALGEDILLEEIEKLDLNSVPSKTLHAQAMQLLKEFYFVGGLPEAVKVYAENRNHEEVRDVHNALLQTYRDDVPKYSQNQGQSNILDVFRYTPANLGKKIKYSGIAKKHSSYIKTAIHLLAMANVIYRTCHNSCSGLPLEAAADCNILKLYFIDIGLYNAMLETEWGDLYQLDPETLLTKGNMAEQFVAQHLSFRHPRKELRPLYFWLRNGKKGKAEVDFIISEQSKIYPLEVKSGSSGKMRSLWQLVYEKKLDTALRLDLSIRKQTASKIRHSVQTVEGVREIECQLIGLPLYVVENLSKILQKNIKELQCPK